MFPNFCRYFLKFQKPNKFFILQFINSFRSLRTGHSNATFDRMNGGAPEAVEVGAHAVEREAGLRGLPG